MNATTHQRRGSRVLSGALKIFGVGILALLVTGVMLLVQIRSDYYARVSVDLAARYADQVMLAIDRHQARYQTWRCPADC